MLVCLIPQVLRLYDAYLWRYPIACLARLAAHGPGHDRSALIVCQGMGIGTNEWLEARLGPSLERNDLVTVLCLFIVIIDIHVSGRPRIYI